MDRATARTAGPILMVDGSNDAVRPKEVHFGALVNKFQNLGAWLPKPKFGARDRESRALNYNKQAG